MDRLEFLERLSGAVDRKYSQKKGYISEEVKTGRAIQYAQDAGILLPSSVDQPHSANPVVRAILFLVDSNTGEPGSVLRELCEIERAWEYFDRQVRRQTQELSGTGG